MEQFNNLVDNYSAAQILNEASSLPKLQAALGQYDFIDQYTKFKVPLKKAYFVSAKLDSAVGYYSEAEIAFAQDTEKVGGLHLSEAGHDVALEADLTYYLGLFND